MVKTNPNFINESSFFDEVNEDLFNINNELTLEMTNYKLNLHSIEMKEFFESGDDTEESKNKAKKNIFARIGQFVMRLLDNIGKLINKSKESLTNQKDGDKAASKLTKILSDNPYLKDDIMEGISKGWYDVPDVAQYEKDIVGLLQMVEQSKLDHQTFLQKVNARITQFNDAIAPASTAIKNVDTFVAIPRNINNTVKACNDLSDILSRKKNECDNQKGDAEVISAELTAINKVLASISKALYANNKNQSRLIDFAEKAEKAADKKNNKK